MSKRKRQRRQPLDAPCALCGQVGKLCRSHIVPRSFIREMRTYGQRLFWHDLGTTRQPIPMQDGWKEHLLCRNCEQRIGRWEKVVCEDLRGKGAGSATQTVIPYDGTVRIPRSVSRPAFHLLETQNCNYAAWRLFLLSLLWRLDRSSLAELAAVDLGDARTEIQNMILADNPGEPMDYPCWIYVLSLSGEPLRGFMSTPHRIEYKGYPAVELAFAGLGWVFVIGRDVACDTMRRLVMDRKGRMRLLIREASTVTWLLEGVKRMDSLGNWTERQL